ncbi:MAG: ComEA family DNA-binding protein [Nanoarchaeota archaeon]
MNDEDWDEEYNGEDDDLEEEEINEEEKINLNTASEKELADALGISKEKAGKIIDYREKHGEFADVEELENVPGFSGKVTEEMLNKLTV